MKTQSRVCTWRLTPFPKSATMTARWKSLIVSPATNGVSNRNQTAAGPEFVVGTLDLPDLDRVSMKENAALVTDALALQRNQRRLIG